MNRRNLIMLVGQLEMHAAAGLPLGQALVCFGGTCSKNVRLKCLRAAEHFASGKKISEALRREFWVPALVVTFMDSGERSGILPKSLASCRRFLEREDELVRRSISAAAYPVVIGCATILLTIGLMEGIMPQITPLLASLHAQLPILTRIVISLSKCIAAYWLRILLASSLAGATLAVLYMKVPACRSLAHTCIIHVPIVGTLASSYALSVFFEAFGAMVEAGIPTADAYSRAAEAVSLVPVRRKFMQKVQPLIRGEPVSSLVSGMHRMPSYAGSLLKTGEASGNLGVCLLRLAKLIDGDLDHSLKRITALIEPAMMMGMGGMVGCVALSIMMPIYDISKVLQR